MRDIIISGIHLDLTDPLKDAVREKAEKLFEHESHIIRMRVELNGKEHNASTATGHLELRGSSLVGSGSHENLYKAIDEMVDKLNRMLRRRSRLDRVKRKHPHDIDLPANLPKAHET